MSNRAWVTLATNDSYSLGALVLAHSLRRASSSYPAVVLITPSVTEPMRDRLRAVFSEVILVDVLDSKDAAHLALLQRPELGITFTKIHCWNLIQYEKCVFLDADALIVQNCDELFEREELSAAPDVGWPDCFNSGVFVFKPSADTFSKLIAFASERGSFDGGDQGLLNSYFSDWAHGDINKHLPFLYNVTSAAFYSYIPALKHYGQNLKIIHFIGANKPWLQNFNWQSRSVEAPEHLRGFLQLWWDLFVAQVHSRLDTQMAVVEEVPLAIELEETTEYEEPIKNYGFYEPILDPSSEFSWHHPDNQTRDTEFSKQDIEMSQFHDPWHIYKGNIPPSNSRMEPIESQRQYAWDYTHPQEQHYTSGNSNNFEQSHGQYEQSSHNQNPNIWQYTPEFVSEPNNIQQFWYSGSSQHDETQQSTSSHNTEHHYTSIQEPIHQQDYQSQSYQQSSPESHNHQDQSHHDQYHNHRNHHHFDHHLNSNYENDGNSQHHEHHQHDHHQSSNYENYSNSHHHEHHQHHYQNNCNQQGFETNRHEQNDNHNHQHLSKHEPQYPHHHSNVEVQRQSVYNYQDTEHNQSSFYNHSQSNSKENSKNVGNNEKVNQNCRANVETSYRQFQRQKQSQHVYTVMMDHEKLHNIRIRNSYLNDCQMECHTAIEEIPRHPYDGFYLRHRATIDPRGRKICIHEIPLSLPSPTPSLESSADYDDAIDTFEEEISFERLNGHESYTGVAGNLAKVVPGAPQQQQAVDELTRRQGWEAGIIDYMGVDSFDNIWAKISQTLSQPPNSPPRQPSPPKEQSDQPSGAPVVEAEEVLVAPIETKPEDSAKGIAPSEDLPENPVAVEAPVVAPEVVAPNDVSVSTEKSENIAPVEAVETVAPTETIESVPEAPACVSPSEASDCVSPPEVLETVAQIAATETVPPSAASDCVSPPEVPETDAQSEALESVSPSEASDCVSPSKAPETVAQIEAEESVSQTEALETVAPIEAPSVSPPQASENISPVTKEIVAIPEAAASVAPTEVTESVSSPDASISVAAVETIASPAAAIDPELIETKEAVASPKTPEPAASVEEPVEDVPVPASDAAEISGKQEDSIPVPVEIAAVPVSAPAESNEGTESPDNIPVTAVEAIKIDSACSAKPSEIPASAPEAQSQDETLIEKSMAVSESSIDKNEAISEPSPGKKEVASDSPPLANTPSKDEIPIAPAVKTTEEAAQETRL